MRPPAIGSCDICGKPGIGQYAGGTGCNEHWRLMFRWPRESTGFRIECAIRRAILWCRYLPTRIARAIN